MSLIPINISFKYNSFVWLPMKTASTHCWGVLQNFDFKTVMFSTDTEEFQKPSVGGIRKEKIKNPHNHACNLFLNHKNFTFISTARNPYSRIISSFVFLNKPEKYENSEWLEGQFQLSILNSQSLYPFIFNHRTPDYFLRVESLYDDYLKIPFIRNSELNISGKLKEMCDKKVNVTKGPYDWRDYYNQDLADLVYYNLSKYFDLLGYDKDSWKK